MSARDNESMLTGMIDSMEDKYACAIEEQSEAAAKAMSAPANHEDELQLSRFLFSERTNNVFKAGDKLDMLRRIAPQEDQTAADLSLLQAKLDIWVWTLNIDASKCVMQHNDIDN